MALISVIMPCYNASKYLADSIESVLRQTYSDIELIAVNDGSTDNTLSILNAYAAKDDRLKIHSQQNAGVSTARNLGVSKSEGRYLAFLDADDWWDETFIETLMAAIENDDSCLAYCGWQNVGLLGGKGEPFVPPDYEALPDKLDKLFSSCRWPINAVLLRRDVFVSADGFDPKLKTSEDFAVWLRLALTNKITLVSKVLAFYRHHGEEQATTNRERLVFDQLYVQQQFLNQYPDIASRLGKSRVRDLTYGVLLQKGYDAYWKRDLKLARRVFRCVMRVGYFKISDLKYILPALFPLFLHKKILGMLDG